jgi:hypothetical protein
MGHSNTAITQNLYQHVRRAVLDQAIDALVRLIPRQRSRTQDAQTQATDTRKAVAV